MPGRDDMSRGAICIAISSCEMVWGLGSALEATHGQMDGLWSQLPYKCHLEEVQLWVIDLRFALDSTPGWCG